MKEKFPRKLKTKVSNSKITITNTLQTNQNQKIPEKKSEHKTEMFTAENLLRKTEKNSTQTTKTEKFPRSKEIRNKK